MVGQERQKRTSPRPHAEGSLPRGRHGLSPGEVEANQRQRIARAVALLVDEEGYDGLTVERLRQAAGVSRSTFYEYFANKQDAVRAAFDLVVEDFVARVHESGAKEFDSASRVRRAITEALEFAYLEPEQAQLLVGYSLCADPRMARHVFAAQDRLALELCAPNGSEAPIVSAQALLGAVTSVLARHLLTEERECPKALEESLVTIVLSPYLGPEGAARAARSKQ